MNRRIVPPTGYAEKGTLAMPTAEGGIELPGELVGIFSPNLDLRRSPTWKTIWEKDTHHYVAGRIYIGVESLPLPAGVLDLHVEYRIFGCIVGFRDLLQSGAVNSFSGPAVFDIDGYKTSFVSLAIDARQIVDGLPSSLDVQTLKMSISGRLFR